MAPSFERGKQTARQFKVLQLLENSRFGMTTRELRDEVVEQLGLRSLHEKTIKRDIEAWRNLGYAIQQLETANPERPKIWKLDRGRMKVQRLPVGVVELLAFSAARELLYPLAGTPYWDGIQRFWERIRESTPPEVLEHLDRQRAGLVVRGAKPKDYSAKEGLLSTLNRAVYEHRTTRIKYRGLGQKRTRVRRIEPHAICLAEGNIYVLAADADVTDGPIKMFKLDRVATVDLEDRRFTPHKDFDPQQYFDHSIGVFRSGQAKKFRIRVDADRAEIALDVLGHPKQRVIEATDQGVIIEIDAAYEEEIIPRVLSLGKSAEILLPRSSRKQMAAIVAELANRY